jgi:hypothetical protein
MEKVLMPQTRVVYLPNFFSMMAKTTSNSQLDPYQYVTRIKSVKIDEDGIKYTLDSLNCQGSVDERDVISAIEFSGFLTDLKERLTTLKLRGA